MKLIVTTAFLTCLACTSSALHAASIEIRLPGDLSEFLKNPDSYPVSKDGVDLLHLDGGAKKKNLEAFKTNAVLIEKGQYKVGLDFDADELVKQLRGWEQGGWNVSGNFVYREEWLAGGTDVKFQDDPRILSAKELTAIRSAIKHASPALACKNSYQLIQLLGGGQVNNVTLFRNYAPETKEYLKQFDGIGLEVHIGDEIPGRKRTELYASMADMAKWAQENDKKCLIFMGGTAATYENFAAMEKSYTLLFAELKKVGIDKNAQHLIYLRQGARPGKYLPESDPNTFMGQTKWLIEQIKGPLPLPSK